jgi:hypothetical protein
MDEDAREAREVLSSPPRGFARSLLG